MTEFCYRRFPRKFLMLRNWHTFEIVYNGSFFQISYTRMENSFFINWFSIIFVYRGFKWSQYWLALFGIRTLFGDLSVNWYTSTTLLVKESLRVLSLPYLAVLKCVSKACVCKLWHRKRFCGRISLQPLSRGHLEVRNMSGLYFTSKST